MVVADTTVTGRAMPVGVGHRGAMLRIAVTIARPATVPGITLIALARVSARLAVVVRRVVRVLRTRHGVMDIAVQPLELPVILVMLSFVGKPRGMLAGMGIFDLLVLAVVFEVVVQMIQLILGSRTFW